MSRLQSDLTGKSNSINKKNNINGSDGPTHIIKPSIDCQNSASAMNSVQKSFANDNDDDWDAPTKSINLPNLPNQYEKNSLKYIPDEFKTKELCLEAVTQKASSTIDTPVVEPVQNIKSSTRFDNMGFKESILRGLYAGGFENPAPSQFSIPAALPDPETGVVRDIILSARAGSGKTVYFTVPALNCVELDIKKPQVIIISPTRELAVQTFGVICSIGAFSGVSVALHRGVGSKTKRDVNTTAFVRGVSVKSESYQTFGNAKEGDEQIIVATPGKLLDIITNERGVRISSTRVINKIDTNFIRMIVMDEADELLSPKNDNDFQDTIAKTFSNIPTIEYCQKIIVSATITDPVLEICNQILQNPIQILVKKEDVNISAIKQYYVSLGEESHKADCLLDIYSNASIGTSIIFANTARKAEYIYELMKEKGFSVGYIHAKLDQKDRDTIMKSFRDGHIRVLIGTDLIARGIDVQTVSVVFNYDLPTSMENYIHRVGRCGRYGRMGVAVNFVVETSNSKPRDISSLEKYYNLDIRPLPDSLDILRL